MMILRMKNLILDFDSETDCEDDVEEERNKSLRKVKCNDQTHVFKTFHDVNPAKEDGSGYVDKLSKEVSGPVDKHIKDVNGPVNGPISRDITKCTATFLAKKVEDTIIPNQSIPTTTLRDQLQKKYQLGFSKMKAYKANQIAKAKVVKDYTEQYSQLRDYVLELQRTNPSRTIKIKVERNIDLEDNCNTRQFKRIYVCRGIENGFKARNRDLLGLDGCFMSGLWPGQILIAALVNCNNGTYLVAYVVVEAKTKDAWMWFLDYLGDYLDLTREYNFTFISDSDVRVAKTLQEALQSPR
ncbi:mutator type transposase [Tanacetum coccineum]